MGEAGFTPGPWKLEHMGGSSTVLCDQRPRHNDTSTPAYGYNEHRGYCIARPFRDDGGRVRDDFVCFSQGDARLIAAAPALYEALEGLIRAYTNHEFGEVDRRLSLRDAEAALALARNTPVSDQGEGE